MIRSFRGLKTPDLKRSFGRLGEAKHVDSIIELEAAILPKPTRGPKAKTAAKRGGRTAAA